MKKAILFAIMTTVALSAAADRFYIEDFTMVPGETRTVSIVLDNEREFTAFQTDIYMPNGLAIEQEDGEYIFDLTSRKARDHNIASQVQADGSVRIMSYSPSVKSYSGNSGALVTFNVTASADFFGLCSIQMKNSLFTTTTGREVVLADETCTVTDSSAVIPGDVDEDGVVGVNDVTMLIDILMGNVSGDYSAMMADYDHDGNVTIADVVALIDALLASN